MAEITLETFIASLRQHKDVCVTFKASSIHNHTAMYRYQLDEHNMVIEVYTVARTVYGICNINDALQMTDNFLMSLREAIRMEPTSSEDKAKFNGVL